VPLQRIPILARILLALALAAPAAAQVKFHPHEPDRADLRAAATLEWFGGTATPEYLDYKAAVAEQELRKWGNLIPGTRAYREDLPQSAIPASSWVNIGPWRGKGQLYVTDPNIADTGRPTVILPHPSNPSLIYVGYAGGGLWRCSNADVTAAGDWTWTPLTDSLPSGSPAGNLSVGGAAFKPEDPNTLYMALGDMEPGSADSTAEGRGFFISADGGSNWTRGGSLGATTRVKTVLALPGNILLVSGNAGLFRSSDAGLSFSAITAAPLSGAQCWEIRKLGNGDLLLSYQASSGGGVLWSADNGLTWTASSFDASLTSFGLRRIGLATVGSTGYGLFADKNNAFQKGVMKSIDNGRSWTWVASGSLFNLSGDGAQAGYNHLIAVDPANPAKVFVGTNLSLYRSLDGGLSWERMTQWMGGDRHYVHADFHVHAWMAAAGGPRTLFLGTDGGLAVVRNPDLSPIPTGSGGMLSDLTYIDNRRNRNVATQLVYHVGSTTAPTPAGAAQRVIIGLQDQGTRVRSETGVAAQAYDVAVGGDGFGCLIHPYDGDRMLGSLYYTRIMRSTNAFASYVQGTGITGAGSSSVAPFFTRLGPDPSDPTGNRVYSYTSYIPYVSQDFGATWTAMPVTGLPSGRAIRNISASPSQPNLVAVALSSGFAITRDGLTWTPILATAFPGNAGASSCAAFDPVDPQILYAASVAFSSGANHIWKSGNGGSTWTALDAGNGFPFGVPVHMVKVDPLDHNTVYAGTDLGIYRSSDAGLSWSRFGAGLPLVSVRDIYLAPDGTFIRIGTHGRGVWEMPGVTTPYPPVISAQPLSQTVYISQAATLGVVAAGLPAPTFQWQTSGDGTTWTNIASNGTSRLYAIAASSLADGRRYRVIVSNSAGSMTSSTATLTVLPAVLPSFTTHPASLTQVTGLRATFSAAVTAAPAASYQWQTCQNGSAWTNLTGATAALFDVYPTAADGGRQYRLAATNMAGTVLSNPATLTLAPSQAQALVNPDFELTPFGNGWTWFTTASTMQSSVTHEGASAAFLGSWGNVVTDWVYQAVAIPAAASSASLTFWLEIANIGSVPATAYNTLTVKLRTAGGADLTTLGSFSNLTTGYSGFAKAGPYDLRAYAGQTVQVYFTSVQSNATYDTAFYIDDVNLLVGAARTRTDFNGDGRSDLLWRNATTGAVFLMPMNGAATLPGAVVHTEPNPAWQIASVADFDGDGKADLLWWNSGTGQVYQMLMNGAAVKSQSLIFTEPNTAWKIVGTGDFSGDGKADILWRNSSTGQVYLMPVSGTSVMPGAVVYTEPRPEWQIVSLADFDGDGKADILWWNGATGQVFLLLMNGAAIKSQTLIYTEANTAWRPVGTGDFNGDGKTDLLWRNSTTGQVFQQPMNGAGVLPGTLIYTEPRKEWQIVAIADFDGDGKADILWWNSATGQVFQMLMNGAAIKSQAVVYSEPDTSWKPVTMVPN
jgi:hypothetical protein